MIEVLGKDDVVNMHKEGASVPGVVDFGRACERMNNFSWRGRWGEAHKGKQPSSERTMLRADVDRRKTAMLWASMRRLDDVQRTCGKGGQIVLLATTKVSID
jgi:hypothetical protein